MTPPLFSALFQIQTSQTWECLHLCPVGTLSWSMALSSPISPSNTLSHALLIHLLYQIKPFYANNAGWSSILCGALSKQDATCLYVVACTCLSACQYDMVGPEGIVESHQIARDGKAGATEAVDCKWYIRAPPRSKVSDIKHHTAIPQPKLSCRLKTNQLE